MTNSSDFRKQKPRWTDWQACQLDVVRVDWERGSGAPDNPFRTATSYYSKEGTLLACRDPINGPLRGEPAPTADEYEGRLGELICLFAPLCVVVVSAVRVELHGDDASSRVTSLFSLDGELLAEHDRRFGAVDAFGSAVLPASGVPA